jgi:hypothetical protein
MNNLGPSPAIKALVEAARRDGPGAAARAKMWTGVSGAVGAAAAGGGAAAGLAKMMAGGTLFGGAMTVGVAAALLYVGNAKGPNAHVARAAAAAPDVVWVAPAVTPPIASEAPAPAAALIATPPPPATTGHPLHTKIAPSPVANSSPYGSLALEASLVAKAQAALVRGDGAAALRAINSTRSLPARQLEPEELAVRAQALRALGKKQQADAADAALKSNYPLSALVRAR